MKKLTNCERKSQKIYNLYIISASNYYLFSQITQKEQAQMRLLKIYIRFLLTFEDSFEEISNPIKYGEQECPNLFKEVSFFFILGFFVLRFFIYRRLRFNGCFVIRILCIANFTLAFCKLMAKSINYCLLNLVITY